MDATTSSNPSFHYSVQVHRPLPAWNASQVHYIALACSWRSTTATGRSFVKATCSSCSATTAPAAAGSICCQCCLCRHAHATRSPWVPNLSSCSAIAHVLQHVHSHTTASPATLPLGRCPQRLQPSANAAATSANCHHARPTGAATWLPTQPASVISVCSSDDASWPPTCINYGFGKRHSLDFATSRNSSRPQRTYPLAAKSSLLPSTQRANGRCRQCWWQEAHEQRTKRCSKPDKFRPPVGRSHFGRRVDRREQRRLWRRQLGLMSPKDLDTLILFSLFSLQV